MAWADKQLKRNTFNEIVPQYFDEVLDDWVPYTEATLAVMQTELSLVKAELEAIKAQQVDGTQKVTLSGNTASSLCIFQRQIYNSFAYVVIELPLHCRGLLIEARIRGVTGTNPKMLMRTAPAAILGPNLNPVLESQRDAIGQITHVWGPGFALGDAKSGHLSADVKTSGIFMPAEGKYAVQLTFQGTYDSGQGFDVEVQCAAFSGGAIRIVS